jgi:hypothetical protein
MQSRTLLSLLAIAVGITLSFSAPAAEAGKNNLTTTALQAGGERLEDLQNPDGGWFFDATDTDCGAGAGVSCPNTFGVTALGLLDAYAATKDPDFLAAAIATGDALVAKQAAAPSCDGNPATGADRPFTVDVTFLMRLAKSVDKAAGKVYANTAKAWFACVMEDFPDAADRADNRIDGRIGQGLTNLGEWDAGLDIEAAQSVGQKKYALAEALQVIARQPDWDVADPDCTGCELLGKGLLLEVTQAFDDDPTVQAAISAWTQDLLAAQESNGSWSDDTQTTAYVLLGLDTMRKTDGVKQAIKKGLLYLHSQGIGNGGYAVGTGSDTEITEVDSEVLQALWANR